MHIGLVDLLWDGHHTPYVVYLSQYFTDQGHQVTYVTDAAHPRLNELPDTDRLSVRALPIPKTGVDPGEGLVASGWEQVVRTRQLGRIYETVRGASVDVLHLLYFDRTQLPFWAASKVWMRRPPLPVVATLHRDAFTDTSSRGLGTRCTQAVTRMALNATLETGALDCLTVHADPIRDRIITSVPAATKTNTRTIPAPTPPIDITATQASAREHLSLPSDAPIALFFGGLRSEKGPDLLAEAVRGIETPLTVVYAGPPADYTAASVSDWQGRVDSPVRIINHVEFIPEAMVDYYFVAADVLVLPYRRTRGISGPLRRACAAGTPVIGNRDSDIGEIIEENHLGWTYESGSVPSLRNSLQAFLDECGSFPTESLSQYAAQNHWQETGAALEAIYRETQE